MKTGMRLLLMLVLCSCGPAAQRVVMGAENNSGQDGFATLEAMGKGVTRIVVDIAAGEETRPQEAHVHEGRCGEIGPIKAGLTSLTPDITKVGRLTSTTEVPLELSTLLSGTFAINVHHARDRSLYISCGQIR